MTRIIKSSKYNLISVTNLLLFLLIVPKFNLIDIPGYHQGIRTENIISGVLLLIILFHSKNFKINDNSKFIFFCGIIFISYLVGVSNNIDIHIATLFRIFEYIVLVFFFSTFELDYKKIISFLKLVIILNVIASLLQYFDIIGYFSSRGYYEANYGLWRAAGIFSGSWESSFISSVLYFITYHHDRKKINIYFFLTLVTLFLAGTRGVMISFFLSIIFLYHGKFKINVFYITITLLSLCVFFIVSSKYFQLDLFLLAESWLRLVFLNENMFSDFNTVKDQYYSWTYRMHEWANHADMFNKNIFTNLFGTGYTSIYYESFILRILFANGIIGLVVIIFFILRLKFYMIIFLIITGLSLDFVASYKMFIALFLYLKCLKFIEK